MFAGVALRKYHDDLGNLYKDNYTVKDRISFNDGMHTQKGKS